MSEIEWNAVYSGRNHSGKIHLQLAVNGPEARKTACGLKAGTDALPLGGAVWCQSCQVAADRYEERAARTAAPA